MFGKYYSFPPKTLNSSKLFFSEAKVSAKFIDIADEAIVKACVDAAREAGITDLYLLDKKFVLDAIIEKQERDNPKPLTLEEIGDMFNEPIWVQENGVGSWFICLGANEHRNEVYLDESRKRPSAPRYGPDFEAYKYKPKGAEENLWPVR